MGYDLSNVNGKYFRWNMWGWAEVVNLALAYGWQPEGTELEYSDQRFDSYQQWEEVSQSLGGSYYGNDGQMVAEEDARAFGEALETSLDDIPDEDIKDRSSTIIDDAFMTERAKVWGQEKATLIAGFSGKENKDYLKEFVSFLKNGAFYIY